VRAANAAAALFQLVEIRDVRIDRVLRDQDRVETKLFGRQHERAVSFP
jgi:hypothetical protein